MLDPKVLRELLAYDPETGALTWRERPRSYAANDMRHRQWNTRFAGKRALDTVHLGGYRFGTVRGETMLAHRAAFAIVTGRWPTKQIDHINGDRADNRWENLREADQSEQNQNMAMRSDNSSGHTGVTFYKPYGNWQARIKLRGRVHHLGYFPSADAAGAAYRAAKRRLHTFNPELREARVGQ